MLHMYDEVKAGVPATTPPCPPDGTTSHSLPADPVFCQKQYKSLFSTPEVKLSVAFGYDDSWPDFAQVDNPSDVADFVDLLTQDCGSTDDVGMEFDNLCEFKRDPDDASLFYKQLTGPDGQTRKIIMHVISATGMDVHLKDNDLQLRVSAEQKKRSEEARQEYMKDLSHADVVLYNGHSRDGGGPDFNPPVLTANHHVDYPWYHLHHPGKNDMVQALSSSTHHPKVIAMLSCDSKLEFQKMLNKVSPDSALLVSNMVAESEDLNQTMRAFFEGLLAQDCSDDFVESMENSEPLVEDHPERGKAPTIDFLGWGLKTPNVTPAPFR